MGGRLPGFLMPGHLVCHCLLIETDQGLVLVDTGVGVRDFEDQTRLGPSRNMLNLTGTAAEAARPQVEALGFKATDVRHIVATHLDMDHAGGIADFPHATVHVLAAEFDAADNRRSPTEKRRYQPVQWKDHGHWSRHPLSNGEPWNGFDAVRDIPGLPPELLLVPLLGHTRGHLGVALDVGDRWLFHAGDAFMDGAALDDRRMPLALGAFQYLACEDRRGAAWNRQRLRTLHAQANDVVIFCAHDAHAFDSVPNR